MASDFHTDAFTTDSLPPSDIDPTFSTTTTSLISSSLGASILAFSDEFFAPASSLLLPSTPIARPGVYVETGAWYDGWETRRHNPSPPDWVIVRLGPRTGKVVGVEVDTGFFVGNHAEEVEVWGCCEEGEDREAADEKVKREGYEGWRKVMGRRKCEGGRRHAWRLKGDGNGDGKGEEEKVTHVKLLMHPDGGIARFRLYGYAVPSFQPVPPGEGEELIDLGSALNGAIATSFSDQHFGRASNLLLPGRGKDMGDGWETKRSREKGHEDWVIVELAARGKVKKVVVDTMHFRGNFPQSVRLHGKDGEKEWQDLSSTKCEKDKEHEVLIDTSSGEVICTHIKMVIVPDGGVKRVRVWGSRV